MNHLDKTLETDYLGSEGVVLQSSQVDRGHGVAKPDGVEQVSPVLESRWERYWHLLVTHAYYEQVVVTTAEVLKWIVAFCYLTSDWSQQQGWRPASANSSSKDKEEEKNEEKKSTTAIQSFAVMEQSCTVGLGYRVLYYLVNKEEEKEEEETEEETAAVCLSRTWNFGSHPPE